MGIFDSLEISASGMSAEREQMDLISANMANINTTHTLAGGPYRRQIALFHEKANFNDYFRTASMKFDGDEQYAVPGDYSPVVGSGVEVVGVAQDPAPPKRVYDPTNPDADEHGYVSMPNVDVITEMTNMLQVSRTYDANAASLEASKSMFVKTMELMK